MKRLFFCLLFTVSILSFTNAQRFFSKDAHVNFSATANASLEKIEASNTKAVCVIDDNTGAIEVAVLVKSFHFERALMEEHFNENYIESHKFPKATFVGIITDIKNVNIKKDGNYTVNVIGKLMLHGITKDVNTSAVISVTNGALNNAKAAFSVKLSDYGIDIPGAVKDKVASDAKIDLNTALSVYK